MLIPQNVGRKWTPETLYTSLDDIKKQNDILDSLQASLDTVTNDRDRFIKEAQDSGDIPSIFSVKLELVESGHEIDHVTKLYNGTRKSMRTNCRNG